MKKLLFLLCFLSASFLTAGDIAPAPYPRELPQSEINREYEKDGRPVISFKTNLSYEDLCKALEDHLGEAWEKKVPSDEEAERKAKLLNDPNALFVGLDVYLNEESPYGYLTVAQILSSAGGKEYPYIVTFSMGPKTEEN